MFGLSVPELLIILVALLLLFGAKRLPEMGRSLGKGMREFKDSVTGSESDPPVALPTPSDTTAHAAPARENETTV